MSNEKDCAWDINGACLCPLGPRAGVKEGLYVRAIQRRSRLQMREESTEAPKPSHIPCRLKGFLKKNAFLAMVRL